MIEGWMGKGPRRWLAREARTHYAIIEVGVWKGLSTRVLGAKTPGRMWAVDTWRGTPDSAEQHALYRDADERGADAVYNEFLANTKDLRAINKVHPVRMHSVAAAAHLFDRLGPTFDMVFIDADHDYEAVKADIEAYRPLLISGGLLAGHDYGKEAFPGVARAVDELLSGVSVGPASIWSVTV